MQLYMSDSWQHALLLLQSKAHKFPPIYNYVILLDFFVRFLD
jgi:hypothetical protein